METNIRMVNTSTIRINRSMATRIRADNDEWCGGAVTWNDAVESRKYRRKKGQGEGPSADVWSGLVLKRLGETGGGVHGVDEGNFSGEVIIRR